MTIAIVGMACRYPGARSPVELWENVLAQRRAFRRIPPERLSLADYFSSDPSTPDCTYAVEAALIEGYEFNRVDFRVVGSTFRSADLVHWLALDIAAQALADAGFAEGKNLPRETTGVLLGNTLTGEFSRANSLRLRWPYVRRVVETQLAQQGMSLEERLAFLKDLEIKYKEPFPEIGEESLAGNLSNTIAGRICNHFDLKGGGYSIDGACSSSLLAIANACSALVTEDLDVAIAGGVDLSLDPFELVGFAKVGALASQEMRVYDARSAGFLPGEGCGFVVLMRYEDAIAQRRQLYAVIRGWGISSDGSGGITRPEVEGQLLALERAYRRAGFDPATVAYFEGHGTGTSVGDATELQVLSRARQEVGSDAPPAAIGSIKANIGHTKAAAGVAGLIKAAMALHAQILPPTTGCEKPHPLLAGEAPALRVLREGEPWTADYPLRAGVSAMGFGGINTHLVLEGVARSRRQRLTHQERNLLSSAQDAELLLLGAPDVTALEQQVERLLTLAPKLSRAEMADLAAQLEKILNADQVRAAVVASSPMELTKCLGTLKSWLAAGEAVHLDSRAGIFLGAGHATPNIGFLFPGQGSPAHLSGGALRRRFKFVQALYEQANLPANGDGIATAVAQPGIVTASMAALRTLNSLGVTANIAVGHSLGELTALHWAGAFDEAALLRIATARGKAMAELGSPTGAMASIRAGQKDVEALLKGEPVALAGLNSPRQTVISGSSSAVATVVARAQERGFKAVKLPVSHAFHSSLVAAATQPLAAHLAQEALQPLQRPVVSTVTGALLAADAELRTLLCEQVTAPVRFMEAIATATMEVELWLEVGPGHVLSGLVTECSSVPVVALDAGGLSLKGLLQGVGAAFALGAPLDHRALFAERFVRPFSLDWQPRFLANPCEQAPVSSAPQRRCPSPAASGGGAQEQEGLSGADQNRNGKGKTEKGKAFSPSPVTASPSSGGVKTQTSPLPASPLELIRQLVAERAELPAAAVNDNSRLLSDLHLNSITVGQLVAQAARSLALPPPVAPTDYADASVAEVAQALEELAKTGGSPSVAFEERSPSGIDAWIRTFTVELVERPLPRRQSPADVGVWQVLAPPDHPLAAALEAAFTEWGGGGGALVCLPPEPDKHSISLLLEGSRAVLGQQGAARLVLVQHGGGAAALARTLHLEAPEVTTCVVDVPVNHPQAQEWVLAEAKAGVGYTEAYYDASGRRREPVLRLLPLPEASARLQLGPDEVLLVTGGGRGITAECAFSLARETGARLTLLGRSQPETNSELSANLERMKAAGVQVRYIAADVTDAEAVRVAVSKVEADLGPITAIWHGAGVNVPKLLSSLDETDFLDALAPKVQGVRNVLAAVNPELLRLFVTFGSIIARTGLPGEAHYGLANEWLTRLTERFQAEHPHCRCLAVEWSVWSGVGMGARLGRVDALVRQGITPIPPDAGIDLLRRLMAQPLPATSVVVTGRFGNPPTLKVEKPELPFLRFLEQPRVYYPKLELVVDVELSADTDPYLNEHVFQGERLLPAVMGLEAMAQVAMALVEAMEPLTFEEVKFNRPVVVRDGTSLTIRIAALVQESGLVEVVLRSEQTAFGVDHFRATAIKSKVKSQKSKVIIQNPKSFIQNPLNPERDLYGEILFHKGRFQRLRGYRHLRATECLAEITPDRGTNWFSRYLPGALVLGDPASRDAAIHALQACIPHGTLLPIGVERLVINSVQTSGTRFVSARERERLGDTFIYDLEVLGTDGSVLESWEGLQLQVIKSREPQNAWVAPLLGSYIERRLKEFISTADVTVIVDRDGTVERRVRSERAIQQALGSTVSVSRRPDGKPEVTNGRGISVAHAGDLTLVIAGSEPIGCDLEPVVARSAAVWHDLLGTQKLALANALVQEKDEALDVTATRIWAASECLKKAGAMVNAPLVLADATADRVVWLASGEKAIATFVVLVREVVQPLVFAVLVRKRLGHCSPQSSNFYIQ